MENTRQTILSILRRRRQATVDELRQELGLAPATVRRHLDILARDGHVDVTQVRRATGRPHYVFLLSESGEDLFPKHYVRMTNRLIEEIVALTPEETAGHSGRELADIVFHKMAERLAQNIGPRVHGLSLAERLETTLEALTGEGITFDVEKRDDGYLLVGHGCPCPRVADSYGQVCDHHRRLLSLLLDTDVSFVAPDSVGQNGYCAYRVRGRGPHDEPRPAAETHLPGQEPVI